MASRSLSLRTKPVSKLTKHYSHWDWARKICEEYCEVINEMVNEDKIRIAEELQDLITGCTSFLEYLGYDEIARGDLARQINEKTINAVILSNDHNVILLFKFFSTFVKFLLTSLKNKCIVCLDSSGGDQVSNIFRRLRGNVPLRRFVKPLGITAQTWSLWERNAALPNKNNMKMLSAKFGFEVLELMLKSNIQTAKEVKG